MWGLADDSERRVAGVILVVFDRRREVGMAPVVIIVHSLVLNPRKVFIRGKVAYRENQVVLTKDEVGYLGGGLVNSNFGVVRKDPNLILDV